MMYKVGEGGECPESSRIMSISDFWKPTNPVPGPKRKASWHGTLIIAIKTIAIKHLRVIMVEKVVGGGSQFTNCHSNQEGHFDCELNKQSVARRE